MRNICKRTESAMETGMIGEGLSWPSWSSTACPPRNLTEGPRVRSGTWPQYIWTAQQLQHRPSPGISHQHIFRPGDQQVQQTAADCDLHYRPISLLVQPPLALDYRWIFLWQLIACTNAHTVIMHAHFVKSWNASTNIIRCLKLSMMENWTAEEILSAPTVRKAVQSPPWMTSTQTLKGSGPKFSLEWYIKSTYARARPQNFVIFYCFLSCMARVLARKTRWAQARKRECRSEVTCSKQQSVNKQLREIFTIFLPDGLRWWNLWTRTNREWLSTLYKRKIKIIHPLFSSILDWQLCWRKD